jgi:hypothetical protein
MVSTRTFALLAVGIFSSLSASGFDPMEALKADIGKKKKDESTWRFLSENKSITPGQTFSVALALSHPAGWHSYYVNSGGVELSPSIKWQLPAGFEVGEIQWPVPHVNQPLYQLDEANPVYSYQYSKEEAFLIVDITAPKILALGSTVELRGKATWQICKDTSRLFMKEGSHFTVNHAQLNLLQRVVLKGILRYLTTKSDLIHVKFATKNLEMTRILENIWKLFMKIRSRFNVNCARQNLILMGIFKSTFG